MLSCDFPNFLRTPILKNIYERFADGKSTSEVDFKLDRFVTLILFDTWKIIKAKLYLLAR